MSDFQASASLTFDDVGGSELKRKLEAAASPLTIEGQIGQTGGGSPAQQAASGNNGGSGRQRQRSRREHRWARQRTNTMDDLLEAVRGLDGDGIGGGGGGGGLGDVPLLGLGAAGSSLFSGGSILGGLGSGGSGGGLLRGLISGGSAAARGAGGALIPGLFGKGAIPDNETVPEDEVPDNRKNLRAYLGMGEESFVDTASSSISKPDWLSDLTNPSFSSPGWVSDLTNFSLDEPNWIGTLTEYALEKPNWLSSLTGYDLERPDWLPDLSGSLSKPGWIPNLQDVFDRPGWLPDLESIFSRPDWLNDIPGIGGGNKNDETKTAAGEQGVRNTDIGPSDIEDPPDNWRNSDVSLGDSPSSSSSGSGDPVSLSQTTQVGDQVIDIDGVGIDEIRDEMDRREEDLRQGMEEARRDIDNLRDQITRGGR